MRRQISLEDFLLAEAEMEYEKIMQKMQQPVCRCVNFRKGQPCCQEITRETADEKAKTQTETD